MRKYNELKKKIASGWNTWNTRSVLSHVHLPEGFAINIGIKEFKTNQVLKEALIGRIGDDAEQIHPGGHSYGGSYTSLSLKWNGIELIISSGVEDDDLVILIEPIALQKKAPLLIVEAGMLWNRPGIIERKGNHLKASLEDRKIEVFFDGTMAEDKNVPSMRPYCALVMDNTIGISTGKKRSVSDIRQIISKRKKEHNNGREKYGDSAEAYHAMQTCLAWDTIYEPSKDRVITPVSRIWSVNNGGYVLFCWDTYFAAYMAFDNKELAYSNAIEITRTLTKSGFVPNMDNPGFTSLDRSQPPVGSMVVRELYRKYREKWLLEEVFDGLTAWNTWFWENRRWDDSMMSWGSNKREEITGFVWETEGVNDTFGGALESGLDNSPMYDDIPFNNNKSMMMLADVGLMGLYIMDCDALADIANELGNSTQVKILSERSRAVTEALNRLWDSDTGLYLNQNLETGAFSNRISPTNFYALFSKDISQNKKERMLQEHFYNPYEFWGEYIMPSISRNDPAYADQDYWRGRIWAPLNFLVYLAMRQAQISGARKDLALKSKELLLKEWLEKGHVHENYNGTTGEGCDVINSDKFYHWGALLSLISLIEEGYLGAPENKL